MSFDELVGGGVLSYGVSLANTAIATDGHGVLYAVLSLPNFRLPRSWTLSLSAAARRTTSAAGADSVLVKMMELGRGARRLLLSYRVDGRSPGRLRAAAIILAGDFIRARVKAFRNFVWGYLDESRKAVVTNPYGTTGEPLVAVTQDVMLLQRPLSGGDCSGKILISGKFELVRRNLEIVRRFGDGNRIVVFAPAERRDEARKLRPERCMLARTVYASADYRAFPAH